MKCGVKWYFTMEGPLGGDEEFGPYNTLDEAMEVMMKEVRKAVELNSCPPRSITIPYTEDQWSEN